MGKAQTFKVDLDRTDSSFSLKVSHPVSGTLSDVELLDCLLRAVKEVSLRAEVPMLAVMQEGIEREGYSVTIAEETPGDKPPNLEVVK